MSNKYAYQGPWITNVLKALAEYGSCLGVLPTGGGKTVCFNEIIRRCVNKDYRVLVLAHREELITQAQEKLWKSHKIIGGIIMSGYKPDYTFPVQIASIQTLVNRRMPPNIKVVIIDEAHHATAETYKKIIAAFPDAKILGVTATPVRTSGEGFDHIFKSMVVGPSIKEMEASGALVPARQCVIPFPPDKLSAIKVTAGEYNEKQLGELFGKCEVSTEMIDHWERYARGLSTVFFAVDINHSNNLVAELRKRGYKAEHVDGETGKDWRKTVFRKLAARELDAVVNVGIATEGTDIPSVQCVALGRPTMSLSLYLQMAGRGARCFHDKHEYLLLDMANCIMNHGEPNQDREWTLKGRKVKSSDKIIRVFNVRFQDGTERIYSADQMPLNRGPLHLTEIKEAYRVSRFDDMLRIAQARDHKPISAAYRFLESYPDASVLEMRYIENKLGFGKGWAEKFFQKNTGRVLRV